MAVQCMFIVIMPPMGQSGYNLERFHFQFIVIAAAIDDL